MKTRKANICLQILYVVLILNNIKGLPLTKKIAQFLGKKSPVRDILFMPVSDHS
jgi:hypothetical protein